ncbi:hypothetical protein PS914_05905 [Pseudomonas fluorescens]|nr:hypothetical protein PS914_05905 [Pseudomonas fluorescens]
MVSVVTAALGSCQHFSNRTKSARQSSAAVRYLRSGASRKDFFRSAAEPTLRISLCPKRKAIKAMENTGLQLRSLIKPSGELELSLRREAIPTPGADEFVIRVQATPINPSDLGWLFGPADLTTVRESGTPEEPVLTARIPEAAMASLASRVGEALPVGNEGAGVVFRAGASLEAQALLGKTVATWSLGMFAQYRCIKAGQCLTLPEDVCAVDGASCFINPMTALCFLDVMKRDGHKALVHTAAASNLGQILLRVCQEDGVNIDQCRPQPSAGGLASRHGRHLRVQHAIADLCRRSYPLPGRN